MCGTEIRTFKTYIFMVFTKNVFRKFICCHPSVFFRFRSYWDIGPHLFMFMTLHFIAAFYNFIFANDNSYPNLSPKQNKPSKHKTGRTDQSPHNWQYTLFLVNICWDVSPLSTAHSPEYDLLHEHLQWTFVQCHQWGRGVLGLGVSEMSKLQWAIFKIIFHIQLPTWLV